MKLTTRETKAREITETVRVLSNKVGRRFDSITLDARDFRQLISLPDYALREWLENWYLGFRPDSSR